MQLKNDLTPKGWLDNITPLLMQGFPFQVTNTAAAIYRDQKLYELTQNRGVVTKIDYVSGNLAMYVNGIDETVWNDTRISLKGGGQDLIVNRLAERWDYLIDWGKDEESLINLRLEGGQTLESTLEIDPATGSTFPIMQTQLIAYYSTKQLEDWRKTIKFKNGTGLKSQDFILTVPAGTDLQFILNDIIPKNQGPVIGVSFLPLSAEIFNWNLDFLVDGLRIIENVNCLRFSRVSQREPNIIFYPFQAGTKFQAILNLSTLISSNDGSFGVTFYFDN